MARLLLAQGAVNWIALTDLSIDYLTANFIRKKIVLPNPRKFICKKFILKNSSLEINPAFIGM